MDLGYASAAPSVDVTRRDNGMIADCHAAVQLVSTSTDPEVRLNAVLLLGLLGQQQHAGPPVDGLQHASFTSIDMAFQTLCSVISMDAVTNIRLEALAALAGKLRQVQYAS